MTFDEQIKKRIVEQLSWDDRVKVADVRVASSGGRVVLAGSVPGFQGLKAAELAAWSVPGVRAVENRLTIRSPAEAEALSDNEVRKAIESKIL